jgi:hypothetical protein
MNIDWQAVSAIFTAIVACCTALSTLVLTVTLVFAHREIREIRHATYATSYKAAVDILQAEDIRSARRFVFTELENKPFENWSKDERRVAEKVCHTYDTVGQMVRHGMLPKKFIVDSWGPSLRRSLPILYPLIASLRTQLNADEVWDDFQWLAKEAESFQKPLY